MGSSAVQQAIALLQDRRTEAAQQAETLAREIAEIDGALRSLGVPRADVVSTDVLASTSGQVADPAAGSGAFVTTTVKSVRSAAQELLDSTPRALSMDEIVSALDGEMRGDRKPERFRAALRTALWTLRNDGLVVQAGFGRNISHKWATDAEGPAVTGPSVDTPNPAEGGDADGTGDHRDLDPNQGHRDHGRGASPLAG